MAGYKGARWGVRIGAFGGHAEIRVQAPIENRMRRIRRGAEPPRRGCSRDRPHGPPVAASAPLFPVARTLPSAALAPAKAAKPTRTEPSRATRLACGESLAVLAEQRLLECAGQRASAGCRSMLGNCSEVQKDWLRPSFGTSPEFLRGSWPPRFPRAAIDTNQGHRAADNTPTACTGWQDLLSETIVPVTLQPIRPAPTR